MKEAGDQTWFSPDAFHGITQFAPQMRQMQATQVAQLDAFELLPEAFGGIQLRGIGRQTLQVEALRCPLREECSDGMAAVDGRTVPDDDHTARDLPQQVLQKGHDISRIYSVVLAVKIQLALQRDCTDRGEVIAGPPVPQNGRVPDGGVGPGDTRQGVKARLIYKEDALLLGLCPLLRAGQVSSRHWAIATSSRWRARRAGFCGLQRIALSKRPT